ncbi:hypothetical protein HNR19_002413 [Nocardioides thalensis]|uniref:SnoaL-like domain-containing protein n=1 Tax=Nocardioides thalensis TaxID=1914755 RepID=A0A853C260_9ACTN|nr:hypothetical protein [Nocardioides thalensis]NYJ01715.1 hypothetical protein [Nocardioides thalensis]
MEDRASRRTVAVTAVVLVAVAALLAVALTGGTTRDPGHGGASSGTTPLRVPRDVTPSAALASLTVLRDWDRRRAAAWRDGDPARLGALYVPGSAAGAHDVAMLERWVRRGLRVRGMAMQVLSVDLRVRTDRRIVLEVTDRLAGPVAVGRGRRWPLPRDGVSVRRLEFRRTAGRWLLAAVQAQPGSTDSPPLRDPIRARWLRCRRSTCTQHAFATVALPSHPSGAARYAANRWIQAQAASSPEATTSATVGSANS